MKKEYGRSDNMSCQQPKEPGGGQLMFFFNRKVLLINKTAPR